MTTAFPPMMVENDGRGVRTKMSFPESSRGRRDILFNESISIASSPLSVTPEVMLLMVDAAVVTVAAVDVLLTTASSSSSSSWDTGDMVSSILPSPKSSFLVRGSKS